MSACLLLYTIAYAESHNKTIVFVLRSNYPLQEQEIKILKTYPKADDIIIADGGTQALENQMQIENIAHGAMFLSSEDLRDNISKLKELGSNFAGYDIERYPGLASSPINEMIDPPKNYYVASKITHGNGLSLISAPDLKITDNFYKSLAPITDVYIIQSQQLESNPSSFKLRMCNLIPKLRQSNSHMKIIIELSTNNGTLGNLIDSFNSVDNIVDGVMVWHQNTNESLDKLDQFYNWFRLKYH